jgi:hypothetical protein
MDEQVIRSFLVSIGYKIDVQSERTFKNSLESITKQVLALGAATAAAAAGIIAGVKVISNQMESLYYASQRTGATVGNIMALRYAAGQIGLTADQAQGSLENFARTLRLNPGTNGLLDSLGVTGKNPAEKFDSFIAKAKQMQPYVAAAYAQLFGIDPDTLLMLEQGQDKRLAAEQDYQKKLAAFGIDPDQAAKSGVDFNNSIRQVTDTFNLLWVVIESKLAPVLTPLIEKFEKWSESHADQVAQAIADAVQNLANWLGRIDWDKTLGAIDHFIDLANRAAQAVGGWGNAFLILAGIKFASIATGIGALAGALTGLLAAGAGFAGWKVGDTIRDQVDKFITEKSGGKYRSLLDIITGTDRSGLDSTGGYTQQEIDSVKDGGGARLTPPRTTSANPELDPGEEIINPTSNAPRTGNAPRGIRNNNPGNIVYGKFAKSMGASGSDGRFAVFQSMEDGIKAAIKLLEGYVAKGTDTVRKIISKWAPSNENDTGAYIDAVAKKLGISADAKLSGDQLGGVAQAIFQHENGRAVGNVNALGQARLGGSARAPSNVSIQQEYTFHIDGSSDPQGTARAVGAEQSRVNGDMVRNFAGAIR